MAYTKIGRQTVNAVRFAEIVQVLLRHGFADLVQRAGLHKGWPGKLLRGMRIMRAPIGEPATFGSRLRSALTELGPTFVKLGQVLSTRPDLIGHTVANELAGLQDKVLPVNFDVIRPIIEHDLGKPVNELFAAIDEVAVASASLSQVYKAVLLTGDVVAVKAQRPNIDRVIESDISLMVTIAEWIGQQIDEAHFLDPKGIVEEFARTIRRELDFEIEAQAAVQFADNFKNDPDVLIPRLYKDYSARRVITLEWIDGVPINTMDAYPARNSDPAKVAKIGCRALCDMVFNHQLFHGDPHPGNIFLMQDNRLAFLDLGMAGHLEEKDVLAFSDLFWAVFNKSTEDCLEAVLLLTAKDEPYNRAPLAHEISEYIAFEAPVIISGGQVVRGLELMVQILRRHNLELGPRFSLLLKALVTIEKVGLQLDPKMDMAPIIRPYIESVVLRRFTPKNLYREFQAHVGGYLRLSRQAPTDITFLLRQLRSGKLKLHIHHEHLETLAATIDQASKRNAVSVVIAALIIGSSLLFATESPFAKLGIVGYIAAGILGFMLIISILWGRDR